jgi:hypothetical protein
LFFDFELLELLVEADPTGGAFIVTNTVLNVCWLILVALTCTTHALRFTISETQIVCAAKRCFETLLSAHEWHELHQMRFNVELISRLKRTTNGR